MEEEKKIVMKCECGKPITIVNKYGMFCEDKCGYKMSREISDGFDRLMDFFEKMLEKK